MARAKTTTPTTPAAAPLPGFDAEATYRIKLKRVVKRGGAILRPIDELIVKGKVAAEIVDAIETAERL
jgi:hypothetical protein